MTTIAVLGLGLIGGSVALAARQAGHQVLGWDADPATRERAAASGLAVTADFSTAGMGVLGLPMPELSGGLAGSLADLGLPDYATITDVGSLKSPVAAAMRSAGLAQRFVAGHPMAGSERCGFSAADPALFIGARWALCVTDGETELARWLAVASVVTDLGAQVVPLTTAEHDTAMGIVSGLPHLLALALSAAALRSGPPVPELAAGSFADLTRVAGSDPTLLHAVTQDNAPAVREALRLVLEQLDRPWADLIQDGTEANARLRGRVQAGSALDEADAMVSSVGELLDLARAGAIVQAVDPASRSLRYRLSGRP